MPHPKLRPAIHLYISHCFNYNKYGARVFLVFTLRPPLDARVIRKENSMAIDGTWEITINSPMGAQKAKLELTANGATLTGTQHAQGSSQPLANGKVDGNAV